MNARHRSLSCPLILALLLFFAAMVPVPPAHARGGVEVDIDFFYDAMAPYGTWIDHDLYGRVWYPNDVADDWRPYTNGHWVYSDFDGWVWVADEDWGWAPFHYGRWVFDEWYGWLWVPGRIWAPAWVYWRYGDGYAAWAPMPPTAVWRPRHGLDHRFFRPERDLAWDCWVSVPEGRLHDWEMHRYIFDRRENRRIFAQSSTIIQIQLIDNRIVNRGVPVQHLERITGSPVSRVHFQEVDRPDHQDHHDRGELRIVRPHFRTDSKDDLRREEEKAQTISRLEEERQRQQPATETKQEKTEPRHAGRFSDKQPPTDQQQPGAPRDRDQQAMPPATPAAGNELPRDLTPNKADQDHPPTPGLGADQKNVQDRRDQATSPDGAVKAPGQESPHGGRDQDRRQMHQDKPDQPEAPTAPTVQPPKPPTPPEQPSIPGVGTGDESAPGRQRPGMGGQAVPPPQGEQQPANIVPPSQLQQQLNTGERQGRPPRGGFRQQQEAPPADNVTPQQIQQPWGRPQPPTDQGQPQGENRGGFRQRPEAPPADNAVPQQFQRPGGRQQQPPPEQGQPRIQNQGPQPQAPAEDKNQGKRQKKQGQQDDETEQQPPQQLPFFRPR